MYLPQRFNYFSPSQFSGTAAQLLGTTQKYAIDRTWPIEEILLHVNFTVATNLTLFPTTAQTPDQFDNVLQLLQHINLSVNDGKQPRSVVDCSGVAMLEYCQQLGLNLPSSTLSLAALTAPTSLLSLSTGAVISSGSPTLFAGSYCLTYRIPMAHPWMGEPLKTRMYLPVHTYPQDPVLTLTFQSAANMYSGGGIGNIFVDVQLIRRVPTAASEALLQKTASTNPNGYIDWDLIETPFSIAPGIGSEQRFPLPIPGAYTDLILRQYLGGANITRFPIDATGSGLTTGTGFGSESRWHMDTGGIVMREWRWRHLREVNDLSQPKWPVWVPSETLSSGTVSAISVATGQIGSPNAFWPMTAGTATNFRNPGTTHFNFLSDGLTGDPGTELGSVLDCNTPANNGLKMEIIGTPLSVATNASLLAVMGRRLFGDLSRWQKFQ
jgi:hypothetical protein